MRSVYENSAFGRSLPSLAAATLIWSCIGCEALLGADFDDYSRALDADGPARDSASGGASGGQGATGGSGGTGGSGNGGTGTGGATNTGGTTNTGGATNTGGTTGTGGGSTGGTTGSGGGTTGATTGTGGANTGGGAGSGASAGSGGTGIPPGDASVLDASTDPRGADDVIGRDGAGGGADSSAPPPRDGGTTGGMCTPGEVHTIATCGNCGLFLQVCNPQSVWDPPTCRQDPSACPPGSNEQRACGSGGTQLATCTPNCTWSLGACMPPTCTVGQMDVQPCSLCGKQTRTCLATEGGAAWGPFAMCTGQGVCAPATSDVTTCGKCGTTTRVCNSSCTWDAWGACTGEGECAPSSQEMRNCQILLPIIVLGQQTRVCEPSCNWGDWSVCK
jgi:hypothetical protein